MPHSAALRSSEDYVVTRQRDPLARNVRLVFTLAGSVVCACAVPEGFDSSDFIDGIAAVLDRRRASLLAAPPPLRLV